jgi:hypothetical protein
VQGDVANTVTTVGNAIDQISQNGTLPLLGEDTDISSTVSSINSAADQGAQSALAPVTSIAPIDVVPDVNQSLPMSELVGMTAEGSMVFPSTSDPSVGNTDMLFNGDHYTDYNLTLQTSPNDGGILGGGAAGVAEQSSDLLGADHTDPSGHADSEVTHATDTAFNDLSNADHELRLSI